MYISPDPFVGVIYRNFDGLGSGCRRIVQYTDHMLGNMLAVGTAPGAGNRSHIADILSAVDKEVSRLKLCCVCIQKFLPTLIQIGIINPPRDTTHWGKL